MQYAQDQDSTASNDSDTQDTDHCEFNCANDEDAQPESEWEQAQHRRREQHRQRRADPKGGFHGKAWQTHAAPNDSSGRAGGSPAFDEFAGNAFFNPMRQRFVDHQYGPGTAKAIVDANVLLTWIDFVPNTNGAIRAIHVGNRSDGAIVHDLDTSLKATRDSQQEIALMVELAHAKGWTTINLKGSKDFCDRATAYAEEHGLRVTGTKHTSRNKNALRDEPTNNASASTDANQLAPSAASFGAASTAQEHDAAQGADKPRNWRAERDDAVDMSPDKDGVYRSDVSSDGTTKTLTVVKKSSGPRM